jgi:non-specific serine/threonine protein kinase/serine/threonine-protein kinase
MNEERHRIVRELFEACLEQPDRNSFLARGCPDAELRREVEALLTAHDRASSFLESPPQVVADEEPKRWIGRRIGVYEIIGEIGSGGMGKVFLATRADDAYRKRVAIKVARAGFDSAEMIERFRQERQILANLQHPNIVRLLDGGATDEGLPYLVMDYLEGERIDRYCQAKALSIPERLKLFRTLCAAVQFAHQNLIIHRDIKPNNILVTRDGVPQLLDFGVAKLLAADAAAAAPHTGTGIRLMTLNYASPEQVLGTTITTATDVYSLGIVLYELLTGRRPYSVANRPDYEAMEIICQKEPSKPSASIQERTESSPNEAGRSAAGVASTGTTLSRVDWRLLTGDLDTIVMKAIRKEPERRYGSADHLSEDIRRYLEGLPVLARGDTLGYRAGKFVKRHTAGVAAICLIGLSLIGGIIGTGWQARIAQRQRVKAEQRFNDVRRLASSSLFEFHDAIANLPGGTPARKLVVSKAVEYLDRLAAEAEGDDALQEELAIAYERVADLQGSPLSMNLGDAKGAVASFGKAHQIRQALYQKHPADPRSRLGLASSVRKLGDGAFAEGKVADSVKSYRQSAAMTEELLSKDGGNLDFQRELAEVSSRLCSVLMPAGDTAGAMAACNRYSALAQPLLEHNPGDLTLRLKIANNATHLGNALRLSGKIDEAQEKFRGAVAQFEAILAREPSNSGAQRSLAMTQAQIGNTLGVQGKASEAAASHEAAVKLMKGLAAADPNNARYRNDLTYMLLRRVGVMLHAGRTSEAKESARAGLAMLKAQAERPEASANDFNDYAWWLSACDVPELRDPAQAMRYATRAVEASERPNAMYLSTLSWAYFRSGDPAKAVEVTEKALATLPPSAKAGPAVGLRAQLERELAEFQKALAQK